MQIANMRRIEIIEAAAQGLPTGDQLYRSIDGEAAATSAAAAAPGAAGAAGSVSAAGAAAAASQHAEEADGTDTLGFAQTGAANSNAGGTLNGSAAASAGAAADLSGAGSAAEGSAVLAAVGGGAAASCKAAALLYSELDVTHPTRKLTQAELYKRIVWELKTQ
jgi:hypothetical protein